MKKDLFVPKSIDIDIEFTVDSDYSPLFLTNNADEILTELRLSDVLSDSQKTLIERVYMLGGNSDTRSIFIDVISKHFLKIDFDSPGIGEMNMKKLDEVMKSSNWGFALIDFNGNVLSHNYRFSMLNGHGKSDIIDKYEISKMNRYFDICRLGFDGKCFLVYENPYYLEKVIDQLNMSLSNVGEINFLLNQLFEHLSPFIPINRISFCSISQSGENFEITPIASINEGITPPNIVQPTIVGKGKRLYGTILGDTMEPISDYRHDYHNSSVVSALKASGIRSGLHVPVYDLNKNPIGIIFFDSVESSSYNSREIGLIKNIRFGISSALQKMSEVKVLKDLTGKDSLTGLANRRKLDEYIEILGLDMYRSYKEGKPRLGCFIHLDLDHFGATNNTYGHDFGDMVLKAVAGILRGVVRKGDSLKIFRVGGEEFLICLENIVNPDNVCSFDEYSHLVSTQDSAALRAIVMDEIFKVGMTNSLKISGKIHDHFNSLIEIKTPNDDDFKPKGSIGISLFSNGLFIDVDGKIKFKDYGNAGSEYFLSNFVSNTERASKVSDLMTYYSKNTGRDRTSICLGVINMFEDGGGNLQVDKDNIIPYEDFVKQLGSKSMRETRGNLDNYVKTLKIDTKDATQQMIQFIKQLSIKIGDEVIYLFEGLQEDDIIQISRYFQLQTYSSGDYIKKQGRSPNYFFAIKQGTVEVRVTTKSGEESICRLGTNDVFGEHSFITSLKTGNLDIKASASVVATDTDNVHLYAISWIDLYKFVKKYPALEKKLLALDGDRNLRNSINNTLPSAISTAFPSSLAISSIHTDSTPLITDIDVNFDTISEITSSIRNMYYPDLYHLFLRLFLTNKNEPAYKDLIISSFTTLEEDFKKSGEKLREFMVGLFLLHFKLRNLSNEENISIKQKFREKLDYLNKLFRESVTGKISENSELHILNILGLFEFMLGSRGKGNGILARIRMLSSNSNFTRIALSNKMLYDTLFTVSDAEVAIISRVLLGADGISNFELKKLNYDIVITYERALIHSFKILKNLSELGICDLTNYEPIVEKFTTIEGVLELSDIAKLEGYFKVVLHAINELLESVYSGNDRYKQQNVNSFLYSILVVLYLKKLYVYFGKNGLIKMSDEKISKNIAYIDESVKILNISILSNNKIIEGEGVHYMYKLLSSNTDGIFYFLESFPENKEKYTVRQLYKKYKEYFESNSKRYFKPGFPLWFNRFKLINLFNQYGKENY